MTREEAERAMRTAHYPEGVTDPWCMTWSARMIDSFVALGMLKLDEPKSAAERLYAELNWPSHGTKHTELHNALCRAGLKIVEK